MAEQPRFTFDPKVARYRDRSGHFLAQDTVWQAVDQVAKTSGDRMAAIAERLRSGSIDLPTFQAGMAGEIKTLHVAMATAAKGGRAQMAPADWGRVGQRIRQEYAYLDGFARGVADGRQPMDGRLVSRARLYADAGRPAYGEAVRQLWADKGEVEERWLRRASESCPGCVEQSGRGWVVEGALPRLGTQQCRSRCKCSIESRPVAQRRAA